MNPAPSFSPRSAAGAAGASVAAVSIQERERERVPFESSPPAGKGGKSPQLSPSAIERGGRGGLPPRPVERNEGFNEGIEGRWFRICRIRYKREARLHFEFSDLEVWQEFF